MNKNLLIIRLMILLLAILAALGGYSTAIVSPNEELRAIGGIILAMVFSYIIGKSSEKRIEF